MVLIAIFSLFVPQLSILEDAPLTPQVSLTALSQPARLGRNGRGRSISAYSARNATIGSTLAALRAGTALARTAMARSTTGTSAKVSGSRGVTPNSNPDMIRLNPSASKPTAKLSETAVLGCAAGRRDAGLGDHRHGTGQEKDARCASAAKAGHGC